MVARGQVIGYEGSTGYSTGPHLHFEAREGATRSCTLTGSAVDPYAGPYSPGTYMWKTNPPGMRGADFSGDGCADVLGRILLQPGDLNLYWGNCGAGGVFWKNSGAPVGIGSDWLQFNWLLEPGDFSGDGCPDILARQPNGLLLRFRWDCVNGGWIPAPGGGYGQQIGAQWDQFDWIFGPGDFSGDGCPDILARQPNGLLLRFRWDCVKQDWIPAPGGGYGQQIGSGWNGYNWIIGSGDFAGGDGSGNLSGDGCPDVMARDPNGVMILFRWDCTNLTWKLWPEGTYGRPVGWGWAPFDWLLGPGDFAGDECPDVLARQPNGAGVLYRWDCVNLTWKRWPEGTYGRQISSYWNWYDKMLPLP